MKTNQEQNLQSQSGSGLIYVLIAVALFAALSYALVRQNDSEETAMLQDENIVMYANYVIQYASQIQMGIDNMIFTGSEVSDLDFSLPGEAAFSAGSAADRVHHVFHPDGGNMSAPTFPQALDQGGSDPVSGWYLGAFNNFEWTETIANDVILTAYNIPENVCAAINEQIEGDPTIPTMSVAPKNVLVDDLRHTGTNINFTATQCPGCDDKIYMCVSDSGGNIFSFFSIIEGK